MILMERGKALAKLGRDAVRKQESLLGARRGKTASSRDTPRAASESEEESEPDPDDYEWRLIDQSRTDRFAHDGDTLIPGAGSRWERRGDGPALAAGPPRSGRIVWQPAGEAALAPQLELDGGAIALAATPPVYVDPEQGLVGTVETGHPPRIAATLLAAPAVPGAAVAAFNAALAQRAPHLAALAAPEPRRERLAGVLPIPVLSLFAADLPPERASPYSYQR